MRTLDLDFSERAARALRRAYFVCGAGVLSILVVGAAYGYLRLQIEGQLAQLTEARRDAETHEATAEHAAVAAETMRRAAAARVRQATLTPWGPLLHELESSMTVDVALLALRIDAVSGSISLTGEARDYEAIPEYLKRLRVKPSIGTPSAIGQQIQSQNPDRPVQFEVTARWIKGPAPLADAPAEKGRHKDEQVTE